MIRSHLSDIVELGNEGCRLLTGCVLRFRAMSVPLTRTDGAEF